MGDQNGTTVGLAVKEKHGAPMKEVDELAVTEEGIDGNVHQRNERRITFLSRERWEAVQQELNTHLPWYIRRANVLVEGLDLGPLIGRSLRVGEVEVHLYGETHPCGQMDAILPGLQDALGPECRGGVHGSVVKGGAIRVGDTISILD